MSTDERLDRLERELMERNRSNRRLLGIVLLLLGVSVTGARSGANGAAQGEDIVDVVRARGFIVVDDTGKTRVELTSRQEALGLSIYDPEGRRRSGVGMFGVDVTDGNGAYGVVLNADRIVLSDEAGNVRLSVSVTDIGATVSLFDEAGTTRATLGATETATADGREPRHPESSLLFFGRDGNGVWRAPQ